MHFLFLCWFFLFPLALVLLNLISLWVDSTNNRRIILLSLSLLGHFIYMKNLFWVVPNNGDTIPDICKENSHENRIIHMVAVNKLLVISIIVFFCIKRCQTNRYAFCDKCKIASIFQYHEAISNNILCYRKRVSFIYNFLFISKG